MRLAPVALAAAVLLALAGCVPSDAPSSPSPSASATPVFASDAEALAAAEKAYAAYEATVDASLQTLSGEGLESVATGKALAAAQSSVRSFRKDGRKQEGDSQVGNVAAADLSALTTAGRADGNAQIYACLDVSMVKVMDASGTQVSVPGRQVIFPTLVSLSWSASNRKLLVSEESVWDGKNFCA